MKNPFKNLFNKNKKDKNLPPADPLTETQVLDILGDAISDVGYWNWWAADLPGIMQLEFGGTQLYFPPTDPSTPPSTRIAIQFRHPTSISFLSRKQDNNANVNWFDDLHQDKMEGPTCSHGEFIFTDQARMKTLLDEAKTIQTIHGYSPRDGLFRDENYKLVFWAGDYGCAVSSLEIKLLTKNGEIKLDEIPRVNSQWWDYWDRYWKLKSTKDALPIDYACEVTIPLKND